MLRAPVRMSVKYDIELRNLPGDGSGDGETRVIDGNNEIGMFAFADVLYEVGSRSIRVVSKPRTSSGG